MYESLAYALSICFILLNTKESGCVGAIAAAVNDSLLYPLDTMKTILQASTWRAKITDVKNMAKFYSGLGVAIPSALVYNFSFFSVYEIANYCQHLKRIIPISLYRERKEY